MPTTIMICDDSMIVRQQVSLALVEAGFAVIEAVDGEDALAKISAESSPIGLLVCDVNMPRMDGLSLLAKLSGDTKTLPFPVLMLTTDGQPELIARAKSFGAKGWVMKPVGPEILVATVKKLCQK
jgi:two-component system, chemotaxis family, chemotaxis protein CheY